MADDKKRLDEIYERQLTEIKEQEKYREFMRDNTVGTHGGMAPVPRPDAKTLDRDLGNLKTEKEQQQEALEAAKKEYDRERAIERNAEKVKRSMERHNKSIEAEKNRPIIRRHSKSKERDGWER